MAKSYDPIKVFEWMGLKGVEQDDYDEYKSLCPFHKDNDPSFYINVRKRVYNCFGCMRKGHLVILIQNLAGIDFLKAAVVQSRLYNREGTISRRPRELRRFPDVLVEQYPRLASSKYLEKRGITDTETLKAFNLRLDTETHRIVIPVYHVDQSLVGFIYRELDPEAKPKYKYSNELYKSLVLFNLVSIAKKGYKAAVIVEGSLDVIRAYDAGYPFCVATLGNPISNEQASLLGQYVKTAYLAFDSDPRGELFESISAMRLSDVNIKVKGVMIPKGRKDLGECTDSELHLALKEARGDAEV